MRNAGILPSTRQLVLTCPLRVLPEDQLRQNALLEGDYSQMGDPVIQNYSRKTDGGCSLCSEALNTSQHWVLFP